MKKRPRLISTLMPRPHPHWSVARLNRVLIAGLLLIKTLLAKGFGHFDVEFLTSLSTNDIYVLRIIVCILYHILLCVNYLLEYSFF